MTSPDHAELRRLAEAAKAVIDGRWEHTEDRHGIQRVGDDYDLICAFGFLNEEDHQWLEYDDAETNAAFIAAANPAAILALLDELKQLRCNQSHLEELETTLRSRVSELEGALKLFTDYFVRAEEDAKYIADGENQLGFDMREALIAVVFNEDDAAEFLDMVARAALSRAGEAADRGGEDG